MLERERERAEEIANEISELRQRIGTLQVEAEPLLLVLIEADAPFKAGQVVSRTRLIGYGRKRRRRVERIRIEGFRTDGHAVGTRILVSGAAGSAVDLYPFEFEQFKAEAEHA